MGTAAGRRGSAPAVNRRLMSIFFIATHQKEKKKKKKKKKRKKVKRFS